MEKDGPTLPGVPTFPRGSGSNCILLYKPIEFVIFQGAGVRTPAPSSGYGDWRYAWGIKNAMSRVVHRVSKAFCAMGSCIIPNVGCEGSLYNVASTLPTCFSPQCMRRSQMN